MPRNTSLLAKAPVRDHLTGTADPRALTALLRLRAAGVELPDLDLGRCAAALQRVDPDALVAYATSPAGRAHVLDRALLTAVVWDRDVVLALIAALRGPTHGRLIYPLLDNPHLTDAERRELWNYLRAAHRGTTKRALPAFDYDQLPDWLIAELAAILPAARLDALPLGRIPTGVLLAKATSTRANETLTKELLNRDDLTAHQRWRLWRTWDPARRSADIYRARRSPVSHVLTALLRRAEVVKTGLLTPDAALDTFLAAAGRSPHPLLPDRIVHAIIDQIAEDTSPLTPTEAREFLTEGDAHTGTTATRLPAAIAACLAGLPTEALGKLAEAPRPTSGPRPQASRYLRRRQEIRELIRTRAWVELAARVRAGDAEAVVAAATVKDPPESSAAAMTTQELAGFVRRHAPWPAVAGTQAGGRAVAAAIVDLTYLGGPESVTAFVAAVETLTGTLQELADAVVAALGGTAGVGGPTLVG